MLKVSSHPGVRIKGVSFQRLLKRDRKTILHKTLEWAFISAVGLGWFAGGCLYSVKKKITLVWWMLLHIVFEKLGLDLFSASLSRNLWNRVWASHSLPVSSVIPPHLWCGCSVRMVLRLKKKKPDSYGGKNYTPPLWKFHLWPERLEDKEC